MIAIILQLENRLPIALIVFLLGIYDLLAGEMMWT